MAIAIASLSILFFCFVLLLHLGIIGTKPIFVRKKKTVVLLDNRRRQEEFLDI